MPERAAQVLSVNGVLYQQYFPDRTGEFSEIKEIEV
jgi:hypothetical protein